MAIRSGLTVDSVSGQLVKPVDPVSYLGLDPSDIPEDVKPEDLGEFFGEEVPEFEPVKPEELPQDLETVDILDFFARAYRTYPRYLLIDLVIVGIVGLISSGVGILFLDMPLMGVPVGLAVFMALLSRLPVRTTRHVIVLRRDDRGSVYLDDQTWWKKDFVKLPDAIQFESPGGKIPWLDVKRKPGEVYRFDPWEGNEPTTKKQAADIINQESLNQSAKSLAMYRANRSLLNKYGWQLVILGVSFILLFMAANRTQDYFGFSNTGSPGIQQSQTSP